MEKTLDKGEEKIRKICDALRRETLEPAQEEAARIVEEAMFKAEQIVKEAQEQGKKYIKESRASIDQERNVFHSSLEQAGKQALEELRQAIEHDLFSNELQKIVEKETADPKIIAKLVDAIVKAVDKEGISTELSVIVPETVSAADVNRALGDGVLKKLKEKGVEVGEFAGGAQVKLLDKKMTIDISDKALIELLTGYVRKDFSETSF